MSASTETFNNESELNQPTENTSVPKYSYYALAVLTLVNFLNYIDRQVLPTVAPYMQKPPSEGGLSLTDTEIGMMEAVLLLSFTVLAPLFGRLGDRYSRTKLMASAAVIWSVATIFTGFADKFPFLPPSLKFTLPIIQFTVGLSSIAVLICVIRTLVGVGESSYTTMTPSLIADYFPPKKRGTALGIFQAAIPLGFALGAVLGALLASMFGWRLSFMIVGIPGIIAAFLVWKLVEPKRGATDIDPHHSGNIQTEGTQANQDSFLKTCLRIITTRDWIISTAGYTALTFVLGAFATWSIIFLSREKGLNETTAGIIFGLVVLTAGAIGTFGGGWIADRYANKHENGYFIVCALSCLLGIVPAFLVLITNNPYFFIPSMFFAVLFLFLNNAPFHAILINSTPSTIRATSIALNIVIIHICGDVISRFGVGIISDSLKEGKLAALGSVARLFGVNPTEQHLTAALMVSPIALIIATLLFFWGSRKKSKA
jgi:MFS transporter, Spinster family, sphingosine-1-phosphate transporter